ncbi:D-tyrosyl-tRNA(Tyr) deacylase [Niallia circulans]|uniref:D-aminoacyl-tRNA deacylase n=1 Tax=Niallia TaxID=2837506 RepID=UPI000BA5ED5E|nr:D-aminoacyl-tRNA deacylase [Niallia circulans]NRG34519.1 D-tyrosyl-tRNA(Tyr) deacylase [Niallia circulans]PAD26085.1 D-tyrosyl-tRNA(Tyr) deacylase [Niallia circulans]PAD86205.1 D-tyrosyl-tRNA(Tyr) deacylase [Niallia circulans]
MRVVLQRSREAKVEVDGEIVGAIEKGFVLLVGITHSDTLEEAKYLADKIAHLRVFEDENGKMNQSILDREGAVLSISQFTLYGDTRKGRRPNFMDAAKPEQAKVLYDQFNTLLRSHGLTVETGIFGAMMDVQLINDGPVTLILDSK